MAVLILYNDFKSADFAESNAGVLEQVNAVRKALAELKVKYRVKSIKAIEQLPKILKDNKQKIIFNLVEELAADIKDACFVPAICRCFSRRFTGNDTAALLLAQNKTQTKAILKNAGIAVPAGVTVDIGEKIYAKTLKPGKYIVKPAFSDASEGIDADSIVQAGSKKLSAAIEKIHKQFGQPAIVEQFIPSRELNVSVIERNGRAEVLAIAEIDFGAFDAEEPKIVDYKAKWQTDSFAYNNTPRILPARLSKKTAEIVQRYALASWKVLDCRDYGRVDFRLDEEGKPYVLEVNPNPDISPDAGFAAAVDYAGIGYRKFVEILLKNAEKLKSEN
ncbi:MAG: ATP-grasp domain-containing protein [Phycisphaerae bacterium]|nr:ATP-grasp domain-containing protein [Phycisphaerae bacterium]